MFGDSDRTTLGFTVIALLTLVTLTMLVTVCDSGASDEARSGTAASLLAAAGGYRPEIDPDNFVAEIDNPYFTLKPGTVFRLRGQTQDEVENETITVTS